MSDDKFETLLMDALFPTTAPELFRAFTTSKLHSMMTGADASISSKSNAHFSAWDGYIEGENLVVEPDRRLLQYWRTAEFAPSEPDSLLELLFVDEETCARLVIHHSYLPPGGAAKYTAGWREFYIEPMTAYFV